MVLLIETRIPNIQCSMVSSHRSSSSLSLSLHQLPTTSIQHNHKLHNHHHHHNNNPKQLSPNHNNSSNLQDRYHHQCPRHRNTPTSTTNTATRQQRMPMLKDSPSNSNVLATLLYRTIRTKTRSAITLVSRTSFLLMDGNLLTVARTQTDNTRSIIGVLVMHIQHERIFTQSEACPFCEILKGF